MKNESFISDGAALRGLRFILGKDNKAISGERFCELTGISPGTLSAVERGTRKYSEELQRKIATRLGAVWIAKWSDWFYVLERKQKYSKEIFGRYLAAIELVEYSRDNDVEQTTKALSLLIQNLPQIDYFHALADIHAQLKKWASDFNLPKDAAGSLNQELADVLLERKGKIFSAPGGSKVQKSSAASFVTKPR